MTRHFARALTATALLSILLFAVTGVSPASAQGETPANGLTLTSMGPAVLLPTSNLTLSGGIHNDASETATNISLSLNISVNPLSSSDELDKITAGNETPQTRPVGGETFVVPATLAPAAAARWSAQVAASSLDLARSGVYYVTVRAESDVGEIGEVHTVFPWFPPDSSVTPVNLVWLWPVSDEPNRSADNTLLSNQTGDEVSAGGRLDRVLDYGLAAGAAATWVIDPQVLETVNQMANGYTIVTATGEQSPGTSAAAAAAWITSIRAGMETRNFYAMPYANPDVTALTSPAVGLSDVVTRSATSADERTTAAIGKPPLSTLGWPAGSRLEVSSLETLHRSGIRTAVVADTAVDNAGEVAATKVSTEGGALISLLSHEAISHAVSDPGPTPDSAVRARQDFLARTALWAQSQSTDSFLVVAPEPLWDPGSSVVLPIIRSLSRAKWLNPVTLAELQADLRARDANPLSLAPMTTAAAREALGPRFTTPMRVSQQRLTGLADIVDTPATVTEPYSLALIRTGSAAWREDRTEGIEFVNTVTTQLINKLNSVHVLPGGVKNLSSENIDIPITIANELPVPVTVGLRLTSNPKVRLSADPVPATTIPANRKVSISVPARVLGSGPIDATAQLLTPEGKAYGRPVSLTLANSTYSQVATWVVTAAFVILVGLLTVNSVRRRRETRRSGDDVAEPEDD